MGDAFIVQKGSRGTKCYCGTFNSGEGLLPGMVASATSITIPAKIREIDGLYIYGGEYVGQNNRLVCFYKNGNHEATQYGTSLNVNRDTEGRVYLSANGSIVTVSLGKTSATQQQRYFRGEYRYVIWGS